MVGKHSAIAPRRRALPRGMIRMVDARRDIPLNQQLLAHLVSDEAATRARRPGGDYIAMCGAVLLTASLSEPDHRGPCPRCYAEVFPACATPFGRQRRNRFADAIPRQQVPGERTGDRW